MNMTKTGQLIAQRRVELGMTQTELAQKLDVTDKAVSKWERGKSMPDIELLNRLATELRVSIIEILSGEISQANRSSNIIENHQQTPESDYADSLELNFSATEDILVSPCLYGCNLEHTRADIYSGLSAQMLRNRKFAGKPSACRGCAAEWYPIGDRAVFTFTGPYTRHSQGYHMKRRMECNSLSIMNPYPDQAAGFGQHDLYISAGKTYQFAIIAKAAGSVCLAVELTSRNGGAVYAHREICVEGGQDWIRFETDLSACASDAEADLRITIKGKGSVCIGAVSLLPEGHFKGMRRDVIDRLREMGVTILRWPGGNFAGEYSWMDGLLPVDMRAPLSSFLGLETQPHSMGFDFHEIGIDEFVALCREVGAQPYITINPAWNTPEENAAWVEYCNGGADTQYGKMRIERGYEEPYNVQLWSLGNEFGYGHMEGDNTPGGYCRIAMENSKKMLEASPGLSLCSSGPYPNEQWAEQSARPLSKFAGMISQHYYGREAVYTDESRIESEYYACLASMNRMREQIHDSRRMLDDNVKISFDEWNVWYAWYRPSSVTDGIYAALAMHMFMDEAEKSGIAMVCHFEAINEGLINVWPESATLTAQGQVFSIMKRHSGGRLCCHTRDAVATVDSAGIITATVINASFDQEKTVNLASCGECIGATLYTSDTVLPPSVFEESDILSEAEKGEVRMPAHSLMLLQFKKN